KIDEIEIIPGHRPSWQIDHTSNGVALSIGTDDKTSCIEGRTTIPMAEIYSIDPSHSAAARSDVNGLVFLDAGIVCALHVAERNKADPMPRKRTRTGQYLTGKLGTYAIVEIESGTLKG